MLTIHRLSAGDGYRYLLQHIAAGDVDRDPSIALTAYYADSGYPPGRWIGSGLDGVGGGQLRVRDHVTEHQMENLFGSGLDPVSAVPLGRLYPTYRSQRERIDERTGRLPTGMAADDRAEQIMRIEAEEKRRRVPVAVAGFDLTFSPVKSVSTLWAVADRATQQQILAAHHEAVADVVRLMEREVAFTRTGAGDPGPTHVHGITPADLADAPRFTDILDAVATQLAGKVVVAHNSPHDLSFLTAEFERAGESTPPWATLCTMELAGRITNAGSHRLAICCEREGIPIDDAHTALGDATATAQLLASYLRHAYDLGIDNLHALGCESATVASPWPRPAHRAPIKPRTRFAVPPPQPDTLARLAQRATITSDGDPRANAYMDVLDRALADRHVTTQEATQLRKVAHSWGLTAAEIQLIHRRYVDAIEQELNQQGDPVDRHTAGPMLEELASVLGVAHLDR